MMLIAVSASATAQNAFLNHFTKLKLEARADAQYFSHTNDAPDEFGFQGRYFNILVGGNITPEMSYYFRQRIVANGGSVNLFDNTDFLYLNYAPSKNLFVRLGKDALAVGGYEYDAPPIDVLFSTQYWDNYYCFQLGASAGYKTDDGNHLFMAQIANSPYVYTGAPAAPGISTPALSGLFGYSLYWAGSLGEHVKTLWSFNAFERERGTFMGYLALGQQFTFGDFDIYVDFMHHNLGLDDWGKNFGLVSRANWHIGSEWTVFAKGSYEQNRSEQDILNYNHGQSSYDCLVQAGHTYCRYGGGVEYRPAFCPSVRLHAYVVYVDEAGDDRVADNGMVFVPKWEHGFVNANLGVTWNLLELKK